MVPWTHWREPLLGRLLTEWTSEFTVFNLVIRLRKGKHSPFFEFHPSLSLVEQWAAATGHPPFSTSLPYWQPRNLLFQLCSRDRLLSQIWHGKATGHSFRCGLLSFWYSRWGRQVVHLINELVNCLYAQLGRLTTFPKGSNTRPLHLGTESLCFGFNHQLHLFYLCPTHHVAFTFAGVANLVIP